MSRFVLDCSMTMAWCFGDEATPRTRAVLASLRSQTAVVPSHWMLEVANALVISERRGRILASEIGPFLRTLSGLPIDIDDQTAEQALGDTLTLARKWKLTAYDAAYLELALREGLPAGQPRRAAEQGGGRAGHCAVPGLIGRTVRSAPRAAAACQSSRW